MCFKIKFFFAQNGVDVLQTLKKFGRSVVLSVLSVNVGFYCEEWQLNVCG
jgi:hypothetical protein